ncbi:hypothetical protein CLCR_03194 [Cladophialophora carrionii]|uniref:Uncharacterized protein n=1 Tax=Cladophialophora carrionii TaxID=86049 RepID=A0A1C1D2A9_9EURO|nr:hypothetical protein CLCR_03194 [Cladophialophora carrionii]
MTMVARARKKSCDREETLVDIITKEAASQEGRRVQCSCLMVVKVPKEIINTQPLRLPNYSQFTAWQFSGSTSRGRRDRSGAKTKSVIPMSYARDAARIDNWNHNSQVEMKP